MMKVKALVLLAVLNASSGLQTVDPRQRDIALRLSSSIADTLPASTKPVTGSAASASAAAAVAVEDATSTSTTEAPAVEEKDVSTPYKQQYKQTYVNPMIEGIVDTLTNGEYKQKIQDLDDEVTSLKSEIQTMKNEMSETNKWHALQIKYKEEHIDALEQLKAHSEQMMQQELSEKQEYIEQLEEDRKHLRTLGRLAVGVVKERITTFMD